MTGQSDHVLCFIHTSKSVIQFSTPLLPLNSVSCTVWISLFHIVCCILSSVLVIQFSAPCHRTLLIIFYVTFLPQYWLFSSVTMYGTIMIIIFVAFSRQYELSCSVHHVVDNLDHILCYILTSVSAIHLSAPCMGQS